MEWQRRQALMVSAQGDWAPAVLVVLERLVDQELSVA